MNPLRSILAFSALTLLCASGAFADGLKAGAASAEFQADDSMVIGGSIGPGKVKGQEGKLRASALVVEDRHGGKIALIACDVLMLTRDTLDSAAHRIEKQTGVPFGHILINATHTHHAPSTITVHGYEREEGFIRQVEEKIVEAAVAASKRLAPATLLFRLGEESSVGKNSRQLLPDGTIYWIGPRDEFVRPTGPFDPQLPVLAFRRDDGKLEAVLFNHSTHTIGTLSGAVRSPSYYGMAAQELEKERGGTFLFFSGASGSTHNLDVPAKEATLRIRNAVAAALDGAEPHKVDRVDGLRSELTVRVRKFDEAKDDAAVVAYCTKRMGGPEKAQYTIDVFRKMRAKLAPMQGQVRKTWVTAITIGDIALVGTPGEYFTYLGMEIKRRSPYRYTYVCQLANDYVGYIPDKVAFDRGGYQVWTGLHSFLERGTGEAIVDEAVKLLGQLHDGRETGSSRP